MTNFVRDNTALAGPKGQWDGASPEGTAPNQYHHSDDYNAFRDALVDIRSWIKTGLTVGTYPLATLTVDADGRITGLAAGSGLTDGDRGDVVVSGGGTIFTIDTGVVSNAKLATMPTLTVKGNKTGGTAAPTDLTVADLLGLLGITPADCGTGDDGSPVFDGTNTFAFANKVGSVYTLTRPVFFDLMTINVGSTLKPDGWPIRCKRAPVVNGSIDISGGNAALGVDGASAVSGSRLLPVSLSTGTASSQAPQVFPASSAANGGATAGGAGTNGAAGTAGTLGRGGGGGAGGNNNPFTAQGASGGNSPNVSPASNTDGDVRALQVAQSGLNYLGTKLTLGTWGAVGGAGGAGTTGGGRGAPGGYMYIAAPGISGTGTIFAKGGNGGAGSAGGAGIGGAGGGGGGAGGVIILAVQGFPVTPTLSVAGGAGGGGGAGGSGPSGNGGAGAAGGDGAIVRI